MKNLKTLPIEFDAKAVKDDGTFEGYASKFGVKDLGDDIVMPGAFTKSLAERPAQRVKMLWQHDPTKPIGSWKHIAEDSKGLPVVGKLNLDVQQGREAHALMKDGAIDGLSIGYVTRDHAFVKGGARELRAVDLHEISVVTFPMLPEATIDAVKDFDPRELEAGLREAGLSRADAVKAVAIFRKSLREAGNVPADDLRDADPRQAADVVSAAQALIASLRA